MPTINHDKTLVCIGNPLEEWIVTSFFAGSRTTMKLILENYMLKHKITKLLKNKDNGLYKNALNALIE